MGPLRSRTVAVVAGFSVLVAAPSLAQPVESPRLAAGVRAYPAGILRALLTVADNPLILRQIAEDPTLLRSPESIQPPVSAELQGALQQLQNVPELISIATAFPEQLAALQTRYEQAPQQAEARIAELRARYESVEFAAAGEWAQLLQAQPKVQAAYARLVTQFTREQLEQYDEFPFVNVQAEAYYRGCLPNELLMVYAQERNVPPALRQVLDAWWATYAPDQVDRRVLTSEEPIDLSRIGDMIYAQPPQLRDPLWDPPASQQDRAELLVPVVMQPPADQPYEARLAYAVAEHARLWGDPVRAATPPVSELPAADELAVAPETLAPEALLPPDFAQQYDEDELEDVLEDIEDALEDGDFDELAEMGIAVPPAITLNDVHIHHRSTYDPYRFGGYFERYTFSYPYYYCYPWTWPVIYHCGPTYYPRNVCRPYVYGRHTTIAHRGAHVHVGLRFGRNHGVYYQCRTPRRHYPVRTHVSYRHRPVRRYYHNYGASHGGPYWRNYGAPYGEHRGYAHQDRGTRVVRPRYSPNQPGTTTYRSPGYRATPNRVVRPRYGPTRGNVRRGVSAYRGRSTTSGGVRVPSQSVRRPAQAYRRPRTATRSSERSVRPGTTIRRPTYGARRARPGVTTRRPGVTTRRPTVGTRRSQSSGVQRRPRTSVRRPSTTIRRPTRSSAGALRSTAPRRGSMRSGSRSQTFRRPRFGPQRSSVGQRSRAPSMRRSTGTRSRAGSISRSGTTRRPQTSARRAPQTRSRSIAPRSRGGSVRRPAAPTRRSSGSPVRRSNSRRGR